LLLQASAEVAHSVTAAASITTTTAVATAVAVTKSATTRKKFSLAKGSLQVRNECANPSIKP
jgi:hypothetical protein